jgi:hypothetical protein
VRLGRTAAERGGTGVSWGRVLAASLLLSALYNERQYREITVPQTTLDSCMNRKEHVVSNVNVIK